MVARLKTLKTYDERRFKAIWSRTRGKERGPQPARWYDEFNCRVKSHRSTFIAAQLARGVFRKAEVYAFSVMAVEQILASSRSRRVRRRFRLEAYTHSLARTGNSSNHPSFPITLAPFTQQPLISFYLARLHILCRYLASLASYQTTSNDLCNTRLPLYRTRPVSFTEDPGSHDALCLPFLLLSLSTSLYNCLQKFYP